MRISDWSSDVCSSDLARWRLAQPRPPRAARLRSEPALPPWPTIDLARAVQSAEHTCDAAFDVLDGKPGSARNLLIGHIVHAMSQEDLALQPRHRSAERRVGKEGVSTCRFRWSP